MPNRLQNSASPYLRQHAHNPVNWYPWGDEALLEARQSQRLMIVSIGYSACHWCHVMERESFENEQVAAVMNTHFVSIKIDREARPDLDALYMQAVQIMSGRGGWPLNVITLPDGRPIYGGTYFKREDWLAVLQQLQQLWEADPEKVMQYATKLREGLQAVNLLPDNIREAFRSTDLSDRADSMRLHFDRRWGGYGQAPKFPMPQLWEFCLHYGSIHKQPEILDQTHFTLEKLALGGIYDQLGGGFARYSVDGFWHVPHFEKMLYDNGQLLQLYAHAFQQNSKPLYEKVMRQTIGWAQRELLLENGLFACALDADSEGEEGKYYVWTLDELQQLLSPEEYTLVQQHYDLGKKGHWEHGNQVLMVFETLEQIALGSGQDLTTLETLLASATAKMLAHRTLRPAPALDNKALLGWNAMFLSGLVAAATALQDAAITQQASTLYGAMEQHFLRNNQWYRLYTSHEKVFAQAEDLSFTATASLDLYELTGNIHYFEQCMAIESLLSDQFYDPTQCLLSMTPLQEADFISRQYEKSDNVIPAASSVYARLLMRLSAHTGSQLLQQRAQEMVLRILPETGSSGWLYFGGWGQAALLLTAPMREVAITGKAAATVAQELRQLYQPQTVWAFGNDEKHPLLLQRVKPDSTLIYVCENRECNLPTSDIAAAKALLS
jgi:uncharacterized protein